MVFGSNRERIWEIFTIFAYYEIKYQKLCQQKVLKEHAQNKIC